MSSPFRSWLSRRLIASAAGVIGALLILEVGLQLASLVMAFDPSARPVPAADRIVVLCVGDSHTWGLGRGYPAALAELLAARAPAYQVVNLGVPGSNTAQLRRRFPAWLDTFRPAVVVAWSGVNNLSNRSDTEVWEASGVSPRPLWEKALALSRVWRFVRLWRHQAVLEHALSAGGPLFAPATYREAGDPRETFRRELPGGVDTQRHERRSATLEPEEVARVTEMDLRWLAEAARGRGIPMVAITYPINFEGFRPVNDGIKQGARAAGIPVVNSTDAAKQLIARNGELVRARLFDSSVHPTQMLYDEVGAMVLAVLDEQEWLPHLSAARSYPPTRSPHR